MAIHHLPDAETLCKLFRYDEETGRLFWRERDQSFFGTGTVAAATAAQRWNTRMAGKEALSTINCHGYKHGTLLGRTTNAHRVIWKMKHGYDAEVIDHISGDKLDNRISNLRNVDQSLNMRNCALRSNTKMGCGGIRKNRNRFTARIVVGNKEKHIGSFRTLDEAIEARKAAEIANGFHPNHGRK